jgi:hypothetical protein
MWKNCQIQWNGEHHLIALEISSPVMREREYRFKNGGCAIFLGRDSIPLSTAIFGEDKALKRTHLKLSFFSLKINSLRKSCSVGKGLFSPIFFSDATS